MYPSKNIVACDMCGAQFEFGPHAYDGRHIARYRLLVCSPCYEGNSDGWNPGMEPKLIAHLKSKGIPIPERNAKGWIPRGD
jgi:hypothetical protein